MEYDAKQKTKSSLIGSLLKGLLVFLLVVVFIFVALFCYLKFGLGFDFFEFRNSLALLGTPVSESSLLTNPFSEDDAKQGFDEVFGENVVYVENGEGYEFLKAVFEVQDMLDNSFLTDVQFASMFDVCLKNDGFSLQDTFDFDVISLRQLTFENFVQGENNTSIDISYVIKLDLRSLKTSQNFLGSFIGNYVPNNLYVSSTFSITKYEDAPFSYEVESKRFFINKLSLEQTDKILDAFKFLFSKEEFGQVFQFVDKNIAEILFGSEENLGFLKSINAVLDFDFSDSDDIYVCLKKA